jgi:hypothetical protein
LVNLWRIANIIFHTGLTLVYCLWISPDEIFNMATSDGIHDCSIVLFVIAERVPSAKKYRNAFEAIRQRVIDQISRAEPPQRRSREAVHGLTAGFAPEADLFEPSSMPFFADNGSFEEFSQIIMDMSGQDFVGQGSGAYDVEGASFYGSAVPISSTDEAIAGDTLYLSSSGIGEAGGTESCAFESASPARFSYA